MEKNKITIEDKQKYYHVIGNVTLFYYVYSLAFNTMRQQFDFFITAVVGLERHRRLHQFDELVGIEKLRLSIDKSEIKALDLKYLEEELQQYVKAQEKDQIETIRRIIQQFAAFEISGTTEEETKQKDKILDILSESSEVYSTGFINHLWKEIMKQYINHYTTPKDKDPQLLEYLKWLLILITKFITRLAETEYDFETIEEEHHESLKRSLETRKKLVKSFNEENLAIVETFYNDFSFHSLSLYNQIMNTLVKNFEKAINPDKELTNLFFNKIEKILNILLSPEFADRFRTQYNQENNPVETSKVLDQLSNFWNNFYNLRKKSPVKITQISKKGSFLFEDLTLAHTVAVSSYVQNYLITVVKIKQIEPTSTNLINIWKMLVKHNTSKLQKSRQLDLILEYRGMLSDPEAFNPYLLEFALIYLRRLARKAKDGRAPKSRVKVTVWEEVLNTVLTKELTYNHAEESFKGFIEELRNVAMRENRYPNEHVYKIYKTWIDLFESPILKKLFKQYGQFSELVYNLAQVLDSRVLFLGNFLGAKETYEKVLSSSLFTEFLLIKWEQFNSEIDQLKINNCIASSSLKVNYEQLYNTVSDLVSIDNFDFNAYWDETKKTAEHMDFKGLNFSIYKFKSTPPSPAKLSEKDSTKSTKSEKPVEKKEGEKEEKDEKAEAKPEKAEKTIVPTDFTNLRHHIRIIQFALAGREGRLASIALMKMAPLLDKLDLLQQTEDDWSLLAEYLLTCANRTLRLVAQLKEPEVSPTTLLDLIKKIIKKFQVPLKERGLTPLNMVSLFSNFYYASMTMKDFYKDTLNDKEILDFLVSNGDLRSYTFWEIGLSQALPLEIAIQVRTKAILYFNNKLDYYLANRSIQTYDFFWESHLAKTQGTIFKLGEKVGELDCLPEHKDPTVVVYEDKRLDILPLLYHSLQPCAKVILEALGNNLIFEFEKALLSFRQPGVGSFMSRHMANLERSILVISTLLQNYPENALYFFNMPLPKEIEAHKKYPEIFPELKCKNFLQFILKYVGYIIPQRTSLFFSVPTQMKRNSADVFVNIDGIPNDVASRLTCIMLQEIVEFLTEITTEETSTPSIYYEEMRETIPHFFFTQFPKVYIQHLGAGLIDKFYKIFQYYFAK